MGTCFLNNVYCCYLPAHCSHGLQPLDNGIFNVLKRSYRQELQKYAILSDSTPVDKVNFIRAYAKARKAAMVEKTIRSGWRVTGNWPISRSKALRHPEIQADKEEVIVEAAPYLPDNTPKCGRHIRDLARNKTPGTRRQFAVIAKGFDAKGQAVADLQVRVASLEEQIARLNRGKKRKAIPNPNRRFMTLSGGLAAGGAIPELNKEETEVILSESDEEEALTDGEEEEAAGAEDTVVIPSPPRITRFGRVVKRRRFS